MSIVQVLSSLVGQLAAGTPLWKIQVPSSLCTNKSALQFVRDDLLHNEARFIQLLKINDEPDPIARMSLLLSAEPPTDKPFNPILGEFIYEKVIVGDVEIEFTAEQLSHHPPIHGYKINAPNFEIHTPHGVEGGKNLKIGLNQVDVLFPTVEVHLKTSRHFMIWSQPSIRLSNLIFGKRVTYINGEFWMKDEKSGMSLIGNFERGLNFKGAIYNKDGSVYDKIEGDFIHGLYFKTSKKKFMHPLEYRELKTIVPESVLQDPMHSENVWGNVFVHMKKSPPDYSNADKEKHILEEAQRALKKTRSVPFVSRFGMSFSDPKQKEE